METQKLAEILILTGLMGFVIFVVAGTAIDWAKNGNTDGKVRRMLYCAGGSILMAAIGGLIL